jgi:hypothetical protein
MGRGHRGEIVGCVSHTTNKYRQQGNGIFIGSPDFKHAGEEPAVKHLGTAEYPPPAENMAVKARRVGSLGVETERGRRQQRSGGAGWLDIAFPYRNLWYNVVC